MTEIPKRTLRAHREALAANPLAYSYDFPRLRETAVNHLRQCGFNRVTLTRCPKLVDQFVALIFESQDRLPFFHVEGHLPFCWNSPKAWDKNYISYEWGHVRSRNQNQDAHQIDNLCLQSARCNQHIQTSMDIEEVILWLAGSPVAERARQVLNKRKELFASENWKNLLKELESFR